MARFAAVGAGRMGRGIAIAFAYAGHRIALIDLKPRTGDAWQRLLDEARAEIRRSLLGLAQLGVVRRGSKPTRSARASNSCLLADAASALAEAQSSSSKGCPKRWRPSATLSIG